MLFRRFDRNVRQPVPSQDVSSHDDTDECFEDTRALEERRREIVGRGEEPSWKVDTVLLSHIAKVPLLWVTLLIYVATRVTAAYFTSLPLFDGLQESGAVVVATGLGVFLSFSLVYMLSEEADAQRQGRLA